MIRFSDWLIYCYNVQLSNPNNGPIEITLSATTGTGSAHFEAGGSSIVITSSQTLTVFGDLESSNADNIALVAKPQRNPTLVLAQKRSSVVKVVISMSASGPSQDSARRQNFLNLVVSGGPLGPAIFRGDKGYICGVGVELADAVTPAIYSGTVTLKRTISSGAWYFGSTKQADLSGPDTSFAAYLDTDPQTGKDPTGKVYDLDAPGIDAERNARRHYRANFVEYAVLGDASSKRNGQR